ncbi:MAG TPA: hypothetical protein VHL11_05160 [Phototrophicaceae bacterium]|jgi:hypothetical protein|nr:hypothetical protein [Phototrophicaceae bacterium]
MMTNNDFPNDDSIPDNFMDDDHVQSDVDLTQTDEFEFTSGSDNYALDDSLDIDAALAAVSSLSDLLAEREAQEIAERQRVETEFQVQEERVRRKEAHVFPHPATVRLQRGSPASLIPALLLMGVGGYLTFALTLTETPPAPGLIVFIVTGAAGLSLVAYWLASGRWSRGSLFAGLSLILVGGWLYALTLPIPVSPRQGWIFLIAAVGLAALLTGLLAKPAAGRFIAFGMALIAGTGILFALSNNLSLIDLFRTAALVILPAMLILMLLSVVFRRRTAASSAAAS